VTLGKFRDDVDVTIGDAEVRAKLTEERIAGPDRNDWDTDRSADAEEERRRADPRERVERETKQERQQLRELANQQARNAEPELHIRPAEPAGPAGQLRGEEVHVVVQLARRRRPRSCRCSSTIAA
jgi:hypothetical protein